MNTFPVGTISYMGGVFATPEEFTFSLSQMCLFNERFGLAGCHYNRPTTSLHDEARNWMVDNMRGDWLLMLDTDHVFRPDIALRLVHRSYTFDLDVVSGFYQYKTWPHAPLIFAWGENVEGVKSITDWHPKHPLFSIDAAGGGCLLVRKSAFVLIIKTLGEKPFDRFDKWGEDLAFFQRLKRVGLRAWCDSRVRCHHINKRPVDMDDLDRTALTEGKMEPCLAHGYN